MIEIKQEDDGEDGQFTLFDEEKIAGEMTYSWAGEDKFIIDHTGIREEYGQKGYGKKLVYEAVEFARNKGVKILPLCPFARALFDKDNSIADVRF